MQGDGNLVAYDGRDAPYWSSYTQGRPGSVLTMGTDGNLVLHNLDGALGWATYTQDHPGAFFVVDDDGNMVVTSTEGEPLWSVWQNTYDRGSGLNQWIGRTEGVIGGIASIAHDAVKLLRVALPAVTAILAAIPAVGLPLAAAVGAVGAEIVAVDAAASLIADQIQQGKDGYNAAVGVLNDDVSPDDIARVRDSLATDEDRAAFDFGLQNAPAIAGSATAVASASAVLRTRIKPGDAARIATILAPPKVIKPGNAAKIVGALPAPAPAYSPGNILSVLAKANGLPSASAYVAKVHAGAAEPPTYAQITGAAPPHAPAPPPPAPKGGGGAGIAIAIGVGALALLALAR